MCTRRLKMSCRGTTLKGAPCRSKPLRGQTCCRYHLDQPACGARVKVFVERSDPPDIAPAATRYLQEHFPGAALVTQAPNENVLEDFALSLVRNVLLPFADERPWSCLIAQDGHFGLVGLAKPHMYLEVIVSAGGRWFVVYAWN